MAMMFMVTVFSVVTRSFRYRLIVPIVVVPGVLIVSTKALAPFEIVAHTAGRLANEAA